MRIGGDQGNAQVPQHRKADFLHHKVSRKAVGRLHNDRAHSITGDTGERSGEARSRLNGKALICDILALYEALLIDLGRMGEDYDFIYPKNR